MDEEIKLRTASQTVGWLNSVGPLNVSPFQKLQIVRALERIQEAWNLSDEELRNVVEGLTRLRQQYEEKEKSWA